VHCRSLEPARWPPRPPRAWMKHHQGSFQRCRDWMQSHRPRQAPDQAQSAERGTRLAACGRSRWGRRRRYQPRHADLGGCSRAAAYANRRATAAPVPRRGIGGRTHPVAVVRTAAIFAMSARAMWNKHTPEVSTLPRNLLLSRSMTQLMDKSLAHHLIELLDQG